MTAPLRFAFLRRAFALIACALLLAACDKAPDFKNLDITGNKQFGSDFSLPDTNGKTRTLADFKGRAVVLFFGYTHCPDVCPTTLAELSQAMQQLGDKSKDVQVLMVTVDPSRDTAPLLSQYVQAFNPTYIGLRPSSEAQLAQVAKDFRVYYAKAQGKTPGDYTMDHTAASYVFDKDGKLRLFARDGQGVEPWVHDLKILID
jgi:protein SCO1